MVRNHLSFRHLLPLCIGILLSAATCFAASLVEEKLNLERSLQTGAERLVEKITGTQDMVVIVNVDLEAEPAAAAEKKDGFTGTQTIEEEFLPGISYAGLKIGYEPPRGTVIKRIGITVTLNKEINDQVAQQVQKDLFEVLGLRTDRADTVTIKKIAFGKPELKDFFTTNFSFSIYWMITLLLIAGFLFGTLRSFLKAIQKTKVQIQASTKLDGDLGDLAASFGGLGGGGGKVTLALEKEAAPKPKHFMFVTEENLPGLIFLLKREPRERVAIVLGFLPPAFASQVFATLSPDDQCYVASILAERRLLQHHEVFAIEDELKQKIDYLTGGAEHLLDLIDNLETGTQENVFKFLNAGKVGLPRHLKGSMFFFKDIVKLDTAAMQKLIRVLINQKVALAIALKSCSPEIKQKFLDAMTEGARAILDEEIRLSGETNPARVAQEQRAIARIVRALEKSGDIAVPRDPAEERALAEAEAFEEEHAPLPAASAAAPLPAPAAPVPSPAPAAASSQDEAATTAVDDFLAAGNEPDTGITEDLPPGPHGVAYTGGSLPHDEGRQEEDTAEGLAAVPRDGATSDGGAVPDAPDSVAPAAPESSPGADVVPSEPFTDNPVVAATAEEEEDLPPGPHGIAYTGAPLPHDDGELAEKPAELAAAVDEHTPSRTEEVPAPAPVDDRSTLPADEPDGPGRADEQADVVPDIETLNAEAPEVREPVLAAESVPEGGESGDALAAGSGVPGFLAEEPPGDAAQPAEDTPAAAAEEYEPIIEASELDRALAGADAGPVPEAPESVVGPEGLIIDGRESSAAAEDAGTDDAVRGTDDALLPPADVGAAPDAASDPESEPARHAAIPEHPAAPEPEQQAASSAAPEDNEPLLADEDPAADDEFAAALRRLEQLKKETIDFQAPPPASVSGQAPDGQSSAVGAPAGRSMEDVFAAAFEDLARLKDSPAPQLQESAPAAAVTATPAAPAAPGGTNLDDVFSAALEGIASLGGSEAAVSPAPPADALSGGDGRAQKGFDAVFDDALAGLSRLREEPPQDAPSGDAPSQDTAAYIEHWQNKLKKEP